MTNVRNTSSNTSKSATASTSRLSLRGGGGTPGPGLTLTLEVNWISREYRTKLRTITIRCGEYRSGL